MFLLAAFEPGGAIHSRHSKPVQARLFRVPVPKAFSFYRLTVFAAGDRSVPDAVRQTADVLRLPLLLPKGGAVPGGVPVFRGAAFRSVLLLNAMAAALPALCPGGARITVLDAAGVLSKRIAALAPAARSLTVVTQHPAAYDAVRQTLLTRFGLSVPVFDRAVDSVFACDALLSPDPAAVPLLFCGRLFTLERVVRPGAEVYTCGALTLPAPYDALCPEGIDPTLFAAALSERCHAHLPPDLTPTLHEA